MKISFPELVAKVAIASGQQKNVTEDFLKALFSLISETLSEGESVKVPYLGTFKLVVIEPRKSVNVNTGKDMEIPSHRRVSFVPNKELAEKINAPFSAFKAVEIDLPSSEDAPVEEEIEKEEIVAEEKPEALSRPVLEEVQAEKTVMEAAKPEVTVEEPAEEEPAEEEPTEEPVVETASVAEEPIEEEPEAVETAEETPEEEVPEEEEVQEEVSEEEEPEEETAEEYEEPEKPKSRFKHGFLAGFLSAAFVIAIILFLTYWFYGHRFVFPMQNQAEASDTTEQTVVDAAEEEEMTAAAEIPEETISAPEEAKKDEPAIQEVKVETKPSEAPAKKEAAPVYDYISTTRYLTTMAKAHYGNYNLWPYIYKENEKFLGHPDRIKPGTRVVIPDLKKYGVNPKSQADIDKAKKMGVEIYNRYK